jgi:hypothetical protein
MRCVKPVSAAGDTTGCSILMSKDTSTVSIGNCTPGGPSSYELPVGAALYRTLAEGSGADGRWQRRAAYGRNCSGRGRQPRLGEFVSALCVRYVDEENLILTSRLSATRTMRFVTARAPTRRRRYGVGLLTVSRPASWYCIPRRQRSSTVRMPTAWRLSQ